MQKRAHVTWQGGLSFEAHAEDGTRVQMAGETEPGGFRPAVLMLAALASCTAMDAISILLKKRQQVDSYVVEVTGEQREDHPRTFVSVVVDHVLQGSALDDRAVARAIELSARKYCLVGASLAAGDTSVRHRFRIRDDAGERECDCLTIGPRGAGLVEAEPAEQLAGSGAGIR